MTTEKLENSIGFQIGFLMYSGATVEDTVRRLKGIALEYAKQFQDKAEKWDKLDDEIGKYYDDDAELDPEREEYGEGNLLDIGEAAASAFGYL